MRRVFIICNCQFPRGEALANYVQSLLVAIESSGYKTILISDTNPEYIEFSPAEVNYGIFSILPIRISNSKLVRYFQYKNGFKKERLSVLKKAGINSDDVVILFGQNRIFYECIISLKKEIGFKTIGGVLEMFGKEDFDGKNAETNFLNYQYVLNSLVTQFDVVMPISTFIENFYKKKLARTFYLPFLINTDDISFVPKHIDKFRFVLPANGKMKDDLRSMIRAFTFLTDDEMHNVELHLCGVDREQIYKILSKEEYVRLTNCLFIHKWMVYEDLVSLYRNMHFLILARGVSQMTLANFPSKIPETMSYGIVPVVSNVGDCTKLYLQNGIDSLFIEGSSEEDCFKSIKKAIGLTEEQYYELSRNAFDCTIKYFNYDVWVPKIRCLLQEL